MYAFKKVIQPDSCLVLHTLELIYYVIYMYNCYRLMHIELLWCYSTLLFHGNAAYFFIVQRYIVTFKK